MSQITLAEGKIHLWRAIQSKIFPKVQLSDLSAQEYEVTAGFKSPKKNREFLVSHWSTRRILSLYGSKSPAEWTFSVSDDGKPGVATEEQIHFNRSHTGDYWVMAVSRQGMLGVDIEEIRVRPQMQAIVRRWFTEQENEHFDTLPHVEQVKFFHDCWTQKEAVLKAWGSGINRLSEYALIEKEFTKIPFLISDKVVGCVAQKIPESGLVPEIIVFDFSGS